AQTEQVRQMSLNGDVLTLIGSAQVGGGAQPRGLTRRRRGPPPGPPPPRPPPPPAGEPGESTRFGALARRMWAPLLAAESQGQP
ncbi:hypothetical protein, partial [Nocardia abscessus]|uniref:hypothetical protein n=1 Tax=Nocardia abscessus TaxID=120957 RepID=UPI0024547240